MAVVEEHQSKTAFVTPDGLYEFRSVCVDPPPPEFPAPYGSGFRWPQIDQVSLLYGRHIAVWIYFS